MSSIPVVKKGQKTFQNIFKPEWDAIPQSIDSDYIYENAELNQVQKHLEIKREHQKQTHKLLDDEWEHILQNKSDMLEEFSSSEKKMQADTASVMRFAEKIKEYKKIQDSLDEQINDLTQQNKQIIDVINEMEKYVNKCSIYENFLQQVAEKSNFNSVSDVLNRYECLKNLREELVTYMNECIECEIGIGKEMVSIMEEKYGMLRLLDNKLIKLQVQEKEVKENRQWWETIVQKWKLSIIRRLEDSEKLKLGCWDLYNSVFTRRNQSTDQKPWQKKHSIPKELLPQSDIQGQLDYIQKSIHFYKEVLRIALTAKPNYTYSMQE